MLSLPDVPVIVQGSPQRVLDHSRLLRQPVMVLHRWSSTRGDDASLDEGLTILRDLQPQ